ncbi:glutathione-dependent disulfide-bond oxidoreductase [Ursidibacter arcticus]
MTNYIPPKVWRWEEQNGGAFAAINRPTSGATFDLTLPQGNKGLQLYSLGTPNGVKITIMLEELLAKGITQADYDLFKIDIRQGDQFGSGFVEINPNSKIPALLDLTSEQPQKVFESGAILLYLAEKFQAFIPSDFSKRTECLSWLFWQMASAPYVGGGFGHFYKYAPEKFEYPINRFTMETKRQLDLLDKHLAKQEYICGGEYTIADIAIWSWYGQLALGLVYDAREFLAIESYPNLLRWANVIYNRPAVQKGLQAEYQPVR